MIDPNRFFCSVWYFSFQVGNRVPRAARRSLYPIGVTFSNESTRMMRFIVCISNMHAIQCFFQYIWLNLVFMVELHANIRWRIIQCVVTRSVSFYTISRIIHDRAARVSDISSMWYKRCMTNNWKIDARVQPIFYTVKSKIFSFTGSFFWSFGTWKTSMSGCNNKYNRAYRAPVLFCRANKHLKRRFWAPDSCDT